MRTLPFTQAEVIGVIEVAATKQLLPRNYRDSDVLKCTDSLDLVEFIMAIEDEFIKQSGVAVTLDQDFMYLSIQEGTMDYNQMVIYVTTTINFKLNNLL